MKYQKSFSKCKGTDYRETPGDVFDYWNNIFKFDTDVCATDGNKKVDNFISEKKDGLLTAWGKVNWCNPPYSNIAPWLLKGVDEQKKGNTTVYLLPCDTSTKWYNNIISVNGRCNIVNWPSRIKFGGSKNNAPFGSSVVILWGNFNDKNILR